MIFYLCISGGALTEIKQNTNLCQFYFDDDQSNHSSEKTAHLDYEWLNDNTVNFTHTYVPFRLRGKGIAEQLVKTALNWAREHRLTIKSQCWYVDKFLLDNS